MSSIPEVPELTINEADRIRAAQQEAHPDADSAKGAVEDEEPGSPPQVSMAGQLGHRGGFAGGGLERTSKEHQADLEAAEEIKDSDTDFPEPGSSPEHSGQGR